MKKRAYYFVLLLGFLAAAPVWAAPAGNFTAIVGLVDVTSPGKAARPVKKGDPVSEGDFIRTKSGARAEITFADGSILRIAPDSRLRITSYLIHGKTADGKLDLFRGKVQSIIRKQMGRLFSRRNANRYEVRTPTAICGIRGTDFFMYYIKGVSGAVFREGKGYGYNIAMPDDVFTIRAGEAMLIQSLADLPFIRGVSEAEITLHLRDTEISAASEDSDEFASKASKTAMDATEETPSTEEERDSSASGLSSFFTGLMGDMGGDETSRIKLFSYDIDIGAYGETENYFYDIDMEDGDGGVRLPEDAEDVESSADRTADRAANWLALYEVLMAVYRLFLKERLAPDFQAGTGAKMAQWMAE